MQEVVLIIQLVVAVALVIVILMQRSEGGAATLTGGASSGSFMSVRGVGSFLTKLTAGLATAFMALCLALAVLAAYGTGESASLMEGAKVPAKPSTEAPAAPAAPAAPSVPLE
ncbi:MAG: preprotein translocase subunit SecG [Sphingomonadales bacterium]